MEFGGKVFNKLLPFILLLLLLLLLLVVEAASIAWVVNFNAPFFYVLHLQMLSVQSPGCAGMERLVVPARSSLGSPHSRDREEL
jgi:hypothetical protein